MVNRSLPSLLKKHTSAEAPVEADAKTAIEKIRDLDHILDRAERAYEIAQLSPEHPNDHKLILDEFWKALMG
jgi:DNA-directed RNA polymerase subunit F